MKIVINPVKNITLSETEPNIMFLYTSTPKYKQQHILYKAVSSVYYMVMESPMMNKNKYNFHFSFAANNPNSKFSTDKYPIPLFKTGE